MYFPVSGVEVSPIIPLIVAFVISFFTSMSGVSGAFLLLPFQMSFLGFTSPSVSPTNLVYNIVAIPSGIYRYIREKRMAWPLATIILVGTIPGVGLGAFLRIRYLPDPRHFKFFVGCVLLYISLRLLYDLTTRAGEKKLKTGALERKFSEETRQIRREQQGESPERATIKTLELSLTHYTYSFYGETFSLNTLVLFSFTFFIGIIGGTYGIGGGAIVAPFLITIFRLPVYTIAGATLLGTFVTSIAGVIFYTVIAPFYSHTGLSVAPDWKLGLLFGVGGFFGIYCGARLQKYFPARAIKFLLGTAILYLSIRYILYIL
ncbi:MAG: sulfite exporter TauE/SafE family protein [Desulfobacterales bacterium]